MDDLEIPVHETCVAVSPALFAWRGGEIVLLGERTGDTWHLARGWRARDCLTDVRRWSFTTPDRFVVQVHRLTREAMKDTGVAADAAQSAAAWVAVVRFGIASNGD